ncbi:MAG: hypothetical protein Q8P03_01200 [bacterium]|nr:hypothetical protein [bacterium]
MANIIAFITLVSSITGLAYLISRKVPALLSVSTQSDESLVATLKNGVEDSTVFKWFTSPEILLQTLLSKVRIFALRLEGKADEWLVGMRKKSQEESKKFTQGYWKEVGKK